MKTQMSLREPLIALESVLARLNVDGAEHLDNAASWSTVDVEELVTVVGQAFDRCVRLAHAKLQKETLRQLESFAPSVHRIMTDQDFLSTLTVSDRLSLPSQLPLLPIIGIGLQVTRHMIKENAKWRVAHCRMLIALSSAANEPCQPLLDVYEENIDGLKKSEYWETIDKVERAALLLSSVESVFLQHCAFSSAQSTIEEACKLVDIQLTLTGALGKRTKFQQDFLAQLVVDVTSTGGEWSGKMEEDSEDNLPQSVTLDDDTVLDGVQLSETAPKETFDKQTSSLSCAALLAAAAVHRRTCHSDPTMTEKLRAYYDKIVAMHNADWSVVAATLHARCRVEQTERRRVERAMAQCESLLATYDKAIVENTPLSVFGTIPCHLPYAFEVRSLYADILVSLGCTSEALQTYESLMLWPQVIECYRKLGKLDRAETLIRDRLAEGDGEAPLLYCLLGDVLDMGEFYERAWDVSEHKFARAQRSLGEMHVRRHNYEAGIDAYNLAIDRQPLNYSSQYNLGYCHMQLKSWTPAMHAYQQCVRLEPDNHEAWNNLGAALLHIGTVDARRRAHRIVQADAIKHSYENWQVWDNYLSLSVSLGEVNEAVRAFNRLVDLKGVTKVDGVLLEAITSLALDGPPDQLKSVRTLTARLASMGAKDSMVYVSRARLHAPTTEASIDEHVTHAAYWQRAYAAVTNNKDWSTDPTSRERAISILHIYVTLYMSMAERLSESQNVQMRSSCRMAVRTMVSTLKKIDQDIEALAQTWDDKESIEKLHELIELQPKLSA